MEPFREEFLKKFNNINFEKIIDHPNILIAAAFWEEDRFCAASLCYKLMRYIDDLIDNHKSVNKTIAPSERQEFVASVNEWMSIRLINEECNPLQKEFLDTVTKFHIPFWPLEDFARSMLYDIDHDGFETLESFLDYSMGASVAPASIFVHLNGLTKDGTAFVAPQFDVREAALPCAIFSYLVHIIRDFEKDQHNNLNYFADDILSKNDLTHSCLHNIAFGAPVTGNFRNLIREYYNLADEYRIRTRKVMDKIMHLHEPRYQLSLEIIFNLYLMVFERIDPDNGLFTSAILNPGPEEIKRRVFETIMAFEPAEAMVNM